MGEDDRRLEYDGEVKSVSAEETFERDTDDRRVLVPALGDQTRELAEKLGKERLAASTVQIKVRYSNFTTLNHQTSVEDPVESAEEIFGIAWLDPAPGVAGGPAPAAPQTGCHRPGSPEHTTRPSPLSSACRKGAPELPANCFELRRHLPHPQVLRPLAPVSSMGIA